MGGKRKGGSARTPYDAPNTLHSAQTLRFVDVVSEGRIHGFVNGNDYPLKSLFIDGTPVQALDGTFNKHGIKMYANFGEGDQSYLPGFDKTEHAVMVGVEVKKATPVTRTITDALVDSVRVTLGVQSLMEIKDNNDTLPTKVTLKVELVKGLFVAHAQTMTINEKGTAPFYQDIVFTKVPEAPFNLRVTRVTADSQTQKLQNKTFFSSYVEMISVKLSYPHTMVVGYELDAAQFGSSRPKRQLLQYGVEIQVPTNYDPKTRKYTGFWDGSFKEAYSDNPAWVFYDLVTTRRYGLGEHMGQFTPDRFALYEIAQFCDQPVSDGMGGTEPMVVCNVFLDEEREASDLLNDLTSAFYGMPLWDGQYLKAVFDGPADPVHVYTNSEVIDGVFEYSSVSKKEIYTTIHVQYQDEQDGYKNKVEYVADHELQRRFGINERKVTNFGCTSRSQANRYGRYLLETAKREQEPVVFKTGRQGLKHLPFDIIGVADNDHAGTDIGGRIQALNGRLVTLDRDVDPVNEGLFSYMAEGKVIDLKIVAQPKANQLRLAETPVGLKKLGVWCLKLTDVKPRLFRALSIADNGDGTYTIAAIEHAPEKQKIVHEGLVLEQQSHTRWDAVPDLNNGTVGADGNDIVLTWDNLTTNTGMLTYEIKLYRDGRFFKLYQNLLEPIFRFEGLPSGEYVAEIKAKNARGQYSNALTQTFRLNYDITDLVTKPKLFGIGLTWQLPEVVTTVVVTELWCAAENDFTKARLLVSLTYPQNSYRHDNLDVSDTYYYWARIKDHQGITGPFTAAVKGAPEQDPDLLLGYLSGQITGTHLGTGLLEQLSSGAAAGANAQEALNKINQEVRDRTNALQAEANTRLAAIRNVSDGLTQETIERKTADQYLQSQIITIKSTTDGHTAAIQAETTARTQADSALGQRVDAVLATSNGNKAAITAEATARTAADNALSQRINTVSAASNTNKSNITSLQQTVVNNAQASTQQIESAQSEWVERQKITYINNAAEAAKRTPRWYLDTYGVTTVREFIGGDHIALNGWGFVTVDTTINYANNLASGYVRQVGMANNTIQFIRYSTSDSTWGGWTRQENIIGAQAKATAARNEAITTSRAELNTFKSTQATKDAAMTQRVDTAESRINGNVASITQQSNTMVSLQGKLSAQYSLQVQTIADNKKAVAGLALGVDGATGESQFIVMANKFAVYDNALRPMFVMVNGKAGFNGDFYVKGSILGEHFKAGQTIQSPVIVGGSIQAAQNRFVVNQDGSVVIRDASGAVLFSSGTNPTRFVSSTNPINASNASTYIQNATIGTLQVLDGSITTSVVSVRNGETWYRQFNTEHEINRVTIEKVGGLVSIQFATLGIRSQLTVLDKKASFTFRIRRDGEVIKIYQFNFNDPYYWKKIFKAYHSSSDGWILGDEDWGFEFKSFSLPILLDKPPNGIHTYTVTFERRNMDKSNSSHSGRGTFVRDSSLTAFISKR